MKKYLVIFMCFSLLLPACSLQVSYIGDRLAPTTSVDIYYSTHDVTKSYKVIGHLNCPNNTQNEIKTILTDYGKKIGADAIVITGRTIDNSGNNVSNVINADALKYTN